MRQLIKEYFSFTKKERIAVVTLVAVILAAYFLPYFIKPAHKSPSAKDLAELKKFEQQFVKEEKMVAENNAKERPPPNELPADHSTPVRLFYFDPNNISEEGWKQLGLRAKIIGTILKYLSKGGRFFEPPDLKKIYGLHADEYERLEPYIRIKQEAQRGGAMKENTADAGMYKHAYADAKKHGYENTYKNNYAGTQTNDYGSIHNEGIYKKPALKSPIDINDADTTALISLPGIGSKLAARIISFREKLGGFHTTAQIAETYGLADSTFQKIHPLLTIHNPQLRKININTATLETLKQHPYIKWSIAIAIIRYREQHGPFTSLADLRQIAAITPDAYNRLLPYVSLPD